MVVERSPRSLLHQIETSPVPLKVLEAIRDLRVHLETLESTALREARESGTSIAHIGEALGTTRQTVYNRLRQLAEEKRPREGADDVIVLDVEPEPQT